MAIINRVKRTDVHCRFETSVRLRIVPTSTSSKEAHMSTRPKTSPPSLLVWTSPRRSHAAHHRTPPPPHIPPRPRIRRRPRHQRLITTKPRIQPLHPLTRQTPRSMDPRTALHILALPHTPRPKILRLHFQRNRPARPVPHLQARRCAPRDKIPQRHTPCEFPNARTSRDAVFQPRAVEGCGYGRQGKRGGGDKED